MTYTEGRASGLSLANKSFNSFSRLFLKYTIAKFKLVIIRSSVQAVGI